MTFRSELNIFSTNPDFVRFSRNNQTVFSSGTLSPLASPKNFLKRV